MPLQRQVVRPGDLRSRPHRNDILTIQYVGWIYDSRNASNGFRGKQFDSTAARGGPIQYPLGLGATMKGWEEALPQMSLGEKTIWIVSPDLAYGSVGLGRLIPPNTTLIFEIELTAINGRKA